ncbi:STAS domain-containing protein [Catenulispora acidiphila]|uniref:STAS domain-containing protein n=1 Tax=Catenulispora acidiphila TaxID=304895 RepID=UPI00167FE2B6|nr:STAS domain-containing protein [Catenulispora acidiphila]
MRIDLSITERGPRLTLAGELDFHTAPEAREALRLLTLKQGGYLVLDLGDVAFFDSSGVATLVHAYRLATQAGATLELVRIPPKIARVLRMVGVYDLLNASGPTAVTAPADEQTT